MVSSAGIRKLCFEQDCEPVWQARDERVARACREAGVACREHVSHTLWEPDVVIRANGGIPPLTYQMFLVSRARAADPAPLLTPTLLGRQHTVATIGDPPRPVPDVDLRGVSFGTLPQSFYEEFTVFDKVRL